MARIYHMMLLVVNWQILVHKYTEGSRMRSKHHPRILSYNEKSKMKGFVAAWDDAIIPYVLDCSIENLPETLEAIRSGMKEWEKNTCIRFVKRKNETFFLRFFRGTHCWAKVGRYANSAVSVGPNCDHRNVMSHEIGHAVGMFHEQKRKDRDEWVKVHWKNIPKEHWDAFEKIKNTGRLTFKYDYASIMHYPLSVNYGYGKGITISMRRNSYGKMPYFKISKTDIAFTSLMYNCPAVESKRKNQKKGIRKTQAIKTFDKNVCVDKYSYCQRWAEAGHCKRSNQARKECPRSCVSKSCKGSDCVDRYPNCKAWGKQGRCRTIRSVQTECQLTCNPTCKTRGCTDKHPKCKTWFKMAKCSKDEATRNLCPKTCGSPFCMKLTPPKRRKRNRSFAYKEDWPNTSYLGIGRLCKDRHHKCTYYARRGLCKVSRKWMMSNCLKSCPTARCDRKIPRPRGRCNKPLGLSRTTKYTLPDSSFRASSELRSKGGWNASAANARLYFEDDKKNKKIGAWCPEHGSRSFIQVDLRRVRTIAYIATQGRANKYQRVSRYKILHSYDGRRFMTYKEKGRNKIYNANCDHVTPVLNTFKRKIRARYIRLYPLAWNRPCLRMELYGC